MYNYVENYKPFYQKHDHSKYCTHTVRATTTGQGNMFKPKGRESHPLSNA